MFNNKIVLVTGGTGSFGKKFCEYLLNNFKPKKLIIFSRDELKQYEMRKKPFINKNKNKIRFFIGDVRDKSRLETALNGVNIVIHAAALKQVDTAEYNPFETIKTNVHGAENIIQASLSNKVEKVLARSKKILKNSKLDDSTDLILQFKNGTMGYLSTILATNKYWELKVFGSNGWIKIFNEKELIQQIGKSKIENINLKYTNIEKRELEEFAKCIKYNKKFSVDLSEVLENTKLFEASIKSKKLNSKFIKI